MPDCVFVIDDNALNRAMTQSVLERRHVCFTFPSWISARAYFAERPPDLILLEIAMSGEDGFAVLSRLKEDPRSHDIPVIFYTSRITRYHEAKGLALGAVDFISKSSTSETLLARIDIHLALRRRKKRLETLVEEKNRTIEQLRDAVNAALSDPAAGRDADAAGRALRIVAYMRVLYLGMARDGVRADLPTSRFVQKVSRSEPACGMSDTGGGDATRHKSERLTPEECEIAAQPAVPGDDVVRRPPDAPHMADFLLTARDIVLARHERWDGDGCPLGLRGERIPLAGRVAALADAYDALRNAAPCRKALSHDDAVDIIRQGRATRFDPYIVDVFLDIHEMFARLADVPAGGDVGKRTL